jgi:hypothetical protein
MRQKTPKFNASLSISIFMPRRKYGHMVGTCPKLPSLGDTQIYATSKLGSLPPVPVEKCNLCCLGYPCPIHNSEKKLDYKVLAKKKRQRYSGRATEIAERFPSMLRKNAKHFS